MLTIESLEDFLGEEVVDSDGKTIGSFACHWEYDDGTPIFLGVDLDDTSKRTHVIPAAGTRLNERQSYLKIAFTRKVVQQAPCLDCGSELNADIEQQVYDYYGLDHKVTESSRKLNGAIRSNVSSAEESDPPIL